MARTSDQDSEKAVPSPTALSAGSKFKRKPRIQDGRYDNFVNRKSKLNPLILVQSLLNQFLVDDVPRDYPRLAAYIDSDVDERLYRRFGYLRTRLLLYRQDEIAELEEELEKLDKELEVKEPYRLCSRRYDEEKKTDDGRLQDLMSRLDSKMKEYDDLLLREHQVMALTRPSWRTFTSFFNFIWNEPPVCEEEYQYI